MVISKDSNIVTTISESGTVSTSTDSPRYSTEDSKKEIETEKFKERILEEHKRDAPVAPPPITGLFTRTPKRDPDAVATQHSVFDDAALAPYFQPSEKYENIHRFDPSFRWTYGEEKSLIRKIDWRVTFWAIMALCALNLDRTNILQANTDNFLPDLGLDTNDYNLGNTVYRVAFLCAELPSQLISKKLGPDRWVPAQMILWSIVAASQFWLSGRQSFLAVRAILGLLQGGCIPDCILYMSYYYTGVELPFRLALFYLANKFTEILSPIMAFGILRLRGYRGAAGWRWLFLIEGILTLLIGVWSIFAMAPSPTQTKAWWRPNGWFTEREEYILGDMHNRQAINFRILWKSLTDYHIWPIYFIGLTWLIPPGPVAQYLTLTLRSLKFDTFESNLLSIPAAVGNALHMLLITYFSERINQRSLIGLWAQVWMLICLIALAALPANTSKWSSYAITMVLLSYPYPHAIQVGWCSRNSNTVRTRTVSAAIYNMTAQSGSIILSNIYRADDKPLYRRGNRVLIGIASMNIVVYILIKIYYTKVNERRDKIWDKLSVLEQLEYRNTTKDEGSMRMDFRFVS